MHRKGKICGGQKPHERVVYIWENNIEMNRHVSVLNVLIMFRIGVIGRFL
jgi:hypothetical protein